MSREELLELAAALLSMSLMLGGLALCASATLGCATVTVVAPGGQAVEFKPGLRNVALCFDEDGQVREVKAYRLSSTFAMQNTVMFGAIGAGLGALVGAPAVGAAVGAGAGLITDALRALEGVASKALEPEPACAYPAPPLRPDEADLPHPKKREVLLPAEKLSQMPTPLARWLERML